MAASGLLHGSLLASLVFFGGSGYKEVASLRVRLVRETSVSLVPPTIERRAPSPPPSVVSARPVAPRTDAVAQPRGVMGPVPVASPGVGIPSTDANSELPGRDPGPADLVADSGGGPEPVGSVGPIGEEESRPATLRPGPASPPSNPNPIPAPTPTEALGKSIFMLQPGSGSGTGHLGRGTADRGIGASGRVSGQSERGGRGDGTGGARGSGGGGLALRGGGSGGSAADILQVIQRRVEQAKVYPDEARRAGLEGTVEVRFRIGPNGSAEALEIVRSSGHSELDENSLQTIRRAGPYPVVTGRIRIPLSYRLNE